MSVVGFRSDSSGNMSVYSLSAFGEPTVLFASSDGVDASDKIFFTEGSHGHPAWAFTRPGRYEIDVYVSGFRDMNGNGTFEPGTDVYTESGVQTLYFGVDFPQANDDAFSFGTGGILYGSVLGNDRVDESFDTGDRDVVSATVVNTTTNGTLSLQPNGSFTYQPSATFDGSDSFTYRLSNERGGFTTAMVTITGTGMPDFVKTLTEGHADIGVNFEEGAWDLHVHDEENEQEYEPDEVLLFVGNAALTTRTSNDPAFDFLGVDAGAPLYILPELENPALLFLGVGAEELVEGLLVDDTVTLQLYSVEGPGQFSMWQSGLTPNVVAATSNGIENSDRFQVVAGSHQHFNYAFTAAGMYAITWIATAIDSSTGETTSSGPVTYHFRAGNAPPDAVDDLYRLAPGGELFGNVQWNDSDSDDAAWTTTLVTPPTQGTLVLQPNGSFKYTPNSTFGGVDSFSYQIADSLGGKDVATVLIRLDDPYLGTNTLSHDHIDVGIGFEEGTWDLHLHDEESETEYEPSEAAIRVDAAARVVRPADVAFNFLGAPVGQVIYILPEVENPELPFLGLGAEEVASGVFQSDRIELKLKSVNGPGQFSLWRSGLNGPELGMATSDGLDTSDTVILTAGGHSHYNWAFTMPGSYRVTFEASAVLPSGETTTSGDVTYTFIVNSDPVANDDSYTATEDQPLLVNASQGLLTNDFDPDGQTTVPAVVKRPANGTVAVNADGSFTYTPNPNFSGTDVFTYTVTDTRYRLIPMGTLGGFSSFALDVNNARQVSGNSSATAGSSNPLQAYLWQYGMMTGLGVLPGTGSNNFSRGFALNDAGVVVGESDNNIPKAFLWDSGTMINLGTLGGTSAVAHDINNLGYVVGASSNGTASKPFVRTESGMIALPTLSSLSNATGRAWSITADGKFIAGVSRANDVDTFSHATLWERQADGTYLAIDLGALVDEDFSSQAYAVNGSGVVVGSSVVGTVSPTSTTSLNRGFYRLENGQLIDIGILVIDPHGGTVKPRISMSQETLWVTLPTSSIRHVRWSCRARRSTRRLDRDDRTQRARHQWHGMATAIGRGYQLRPRYHRFWNPKRGRYESNTSILVGTGDGGW